MIREVKAKALSEKTLGRSKSVTLIMQKNSERLSLERSADERC